MAQRTKVAQTLARRLYEMLGSAGDYYFGGTITTTYSKKSFGFLSQGFIITNDDALIVISFSFNGTDLHGTLKAGESIQFDKRHRTDIWVKSASATPTCRIWAW